MIKLMLLTANTELILEAGNTGVDRIFLDLEYINKVERQKGRNTFISHNQIADVARIKKIIKDQELLVRVNPINPNSKYEIEKSISDGADILMLPMLLDNDDAKQFIHFVNGKAKVCLLLETAQSLVRLDDILDVAGIDEVFIGLNDLHISMGLTFMFELLSGGIVEYMAQKIKHRNISFGFGGIAKIGEGTLPAECILAEHIYLGSSSVILSRVFRNEGVLSSPKVDIGFEVKRIREKEQEIQKWSEIDFLNNRQRIANCVRKVVSDMHNNSSTLL